MNYDEFEALSISEAVLSVAKENLKNTAITYMNKKISYKTFLQKIKKLSLAFFSFGVKKGDVVLVALPNIPQAVYILYALNRIGAVPAFVSPLSAEAELELYIKKCRSSIIVALDEHYEKLLRVMAKTGDKTLILTSAFDEIIFTAKKSLPKVVHWNALFKNKSENIYISPLKPKDTAVILFSGGTTGTPKAVELTNLNLNALALGTESACEKGVERVKMLSVLPVFHGFGLGIAIHTVLFFGGNILLVPRFNAEKVGRIIRRNKPDYLAFVPAILEPIINAKTLKSADLSHVLGVFSGGDTLNSELKNRFDTFLSKHKAKTHIRQGYGLTECVAASCLMPDNKSKADSVGLPYRDTEYKIVTPYTCDEAPEGSTGEICISGKTVMKGYLDDKYETQRVLKHHSDGNLWLHTGDLGCIDDEGFVYFKGRLKRVIISNGHNVYPSEIENALNKLPYIKECCAVGVSDNRKVQAVALFAVLKQNEIVKKEDILKHLQSYVSKYALPEYVYFIDSLPKTHLGKVAFKELEKTAEDYKKQK